jgi:biotin synthase
MIRSEIIELLQLRGSAQQELFQRARTARRSHFADGATVRGVIEVASACVQNCSYCPMRLDNRMPRYIYRADRIVDLSRHIHAAGIRTVSLQAGDIPRTTQTVGEAIPEIRRIFAGEVDILLVLGDKSRDEYAYLREQGATSYILKHETSDPRLHQEHRFYAVEDRLACLENLMSLGYRVGTGTIVGLPGQTLEILADDILLARSLGVHMCSASPFVPAPGTPLADAEPGDVDLTLNALAVMRLVMPGALIPSVSALQKQVPGAQALGFAAGANVITVNFTPDGDQANYPIYGADRFIVGRDYASQLLLEAGLRPDIAHATEQETPARSRRAGS